MVPNVAGSRDAMFDGGCDGRWWRALFLWLLRVVSSAINGRGNVEQ